MDVAGANLHPRQGRIQFIQAIVCHRGIQLKIESSNLGNALIYNYDQKSFAGGVLLYKNNGQPPANEMEAFVMATE